ncbi:MAG TPA: glycosyltransferase [Polyangiaceae bacterium]|nr:glycosyltransferase [Polyangiaceae bacterium]
MGALLILFEAYRLTLRVLVLVMSAQLVLATITYLRRRRSLVEPPLPATLPRVTVQLPVRNEYYTVVRIIEAAAALDYPRDLLEIQVLDDSDDQTVGVIVDAVARLRKAGVDIIQLRRFTPTDFKAGALAYGMSLAKGELVAIFDADFLPSPDFLKRTVRYFADPAVGLVQARWEHENREESWFTRLQAQILDGLMVVEQTAKSRAGLPLQFNGTAGVWRRAAIDEAGGWTFDSLTEDFDLSLRAQLLGYRLVHLPEVAVPAELPTTLGLFRVQQRRWALGTAQLLRKRLPIVLRSNLPLAGRAALALQLLRHFGYPLLVLMVLTVPLTTFDVVKPAIDYGIVNAAVLAVALFAVGAQQALAERELGRGVLGALLLSPLSLALAIGLAPTYTVALAYGLLDRAGAFHRTPKVPRARRPGEPAYQATRSLLVVVELAVAAAYSLFTVLSLGRGLYVEGSFLALIAFSYGWVGIGSLNVGAAPAETAENAYGRVPVGRLPPA